jgi:hypothetical protein
VGALALADGKIFAGTYFPKENWLEMLHYFVDMQNKTPQALIDQPKSDGRREKC